jgi:hypothetical protein
MRASLVPAAFSASGLAGQDEAGGEAGGLARDRIGRETRQSMRISLAMTAATTVSSRGGV